MAKKQLVIIPVMLSALVLFSGCSVDSLDTGVQRYVVDYIKGRVNSVNKAEDIQKTIQNYNPVFDTEEEILPQDQISQQVNELIKKNLTATFVDSKLVFAGNSSNTPFVIKYVVKRRISRDDAELLHKALIDSESRAKDDAMPNYYESRGTAEFSVYHDFGGRSYILAVVLDLNEQAVWVNVY